MAQGSIGRNERCPCGSGRRYKECHGAIAAVAVSAPPRSVPSPTATSVAELMQAAARAHRNSNLLEAAALYRRVLEVDPTNYDATHTLGLIEYQSGPSEAAIARVRRATELRPDLPMARASLQTLQALPLIEREICREVLPRLLPRVEPIVDLGARATAADAVHLVLAGTVPASGEPALAQFVAALPAARLMLWARPGGAPAAAAARILDVATGSYPDGGLLLLYGASASVAGWIAAARASQVILVIAEDDPCAVIDRVDELCAPGGVRPGLVCVSRALAERLRLPVQAVAPVPERP